MTMRIVVLKEEEGFETGSEYFIDRTKALKMVEEGRATTPNLYKKIVKKKAEETTRLKQEEAKRKAEEKKKADLLKKREEEKAENATSVKVTNRSKAVKKVVKKK